ncbi:MAG: queA [Betaproteobacteria bacterium]|nr:queA [Betaproteobacteria bacterium]
MAFTLSDFDFELPSELIAQFPPAERTASRLLVPAAGQFSDLHFRDLPQLLSPGDLLVFNQTRVVKARLFGEKASGGKIELLIERVLDAHSALAHIRASKSPKPGSLLNIAGATATVEEKRDALYLLRFAGPATVFELMDAHGAVPLPPYIEHDASAQDIERYQTVYARTPGAVAAPTAGLHFDEALLDTLRAQGVHTAFLTLHVGAGTFQPVRGDRIEEHVMHSEWYDITPETVAAITAAKQRGNKVIAVGTTSVRALESAALRANPNANQGELLAPGADDTRIFITPGFEYKVVDRLITNFHLPKSTLLMLVSAFAGHDLMLKVYAHAIAQRYRFFSYGDAMLLDRAP